MKIDFSNYKFHASGIKNLMVYPKTKKAKEAGELSETTKSYLREIWIEEVLGRKKEIITPQMQKGTAVESLSMELYQRVNNKPYFKNNKTLENEFIIGTPDIVTNDSIKDIKSSWDLWTFAEVDEKKARDSYYWQVLSYMWLTGTKKASLIYSLVNTPTWIMAGESAKLSWKIGDEKAEKIVEVNHIFDDIDEKLRIKEFFFEINNDDIDKISERVIASRKYLQEFKL